MSKKEEVAAAAPKVKKAPMTRELIEAQVNLGKTRGQVVEILGKKGITTTVGYVSTIAKNYGLTLVTERQLKKEAAEAKAAKEAAKAPKA